MKKATLFVRLETKIVPLESNHLDHCYLVNHNPGISHSELLGPSTEQSTPVQTKTERIPIRQYHKPNGSICYVGISNQVNRHLDNLFQLWENEKVERCIGEKIRLSTELVHTQVKLQTYNKATLLQRLKFLFTKRL